MAASSVFALHGFLGHPAAFAALGLEQFGGEVSVPHLLGHGPNPELGSPTFATEVERLARLAEQLPKPRRLVGYSQGARLGLALLATRPNLFESALLIGAQPGCRDQAERIARRTLEDRWLAELQDLGVPSFVDRFSQLPLFGPVRALSELRAERPERWDHEQRGLISALLVLGTSQMPNLWPKLPSIESPVELWVGSMDAKFVDIADQMQRLLPRARTTTFQGAYHNPIIDCPLDARDRFAAWLSA